jgi:hypothetical protein
VFSLTSGGQPDGGLAAGLEPFGFKDLSPV